MDVVLLERHCAFLNEKKFCNIEGFVVTEKGNNDYILAKKEEYI